MTSKIHQAAQHHCSSRWLCMHVWLWSLEHNTINLLITIVVKWWGSHSLVTKLMQQVCELLLPLGAQSSLCFGQVNLDRCWQIHPTLIISTFKIPMWSPSIHNQTLKLLIRRNSSVYRRVVSGGIWTDAAWTKFPDCFLLPVPPAGKRSHSETTTGIHLHMKTGCVVRIHSSCLKINFTFSHFCLLASFTQFTEVLGPSSTTRSIFKWTEYLSY